MSENGLDRQKPQFWWFWMGYIYIYNDDRPWHGIGYLILDRPTHTSIGKFTPLAYHLPATMGNFPVYQVGLRLWSMFEPFWNHRERIAMCPKYQKIPTIFTNATCIIAKNVFTYNTWMWVHILIWGPIGTDPFKKKDWIYGRHLVENGHFRRDWQNTRCIVIYI